MLKGADFKLQRRQRMALGGSNGSGKSTFLALLTGLLPPVSGTIFLFGKECRDENDFYPVRKKTGMLFQNRDEQLFCPTVAEDIGFGPVNLGWNYSEVHRSITDILDELAIPALRNRLIDSLSEGEKQLVALATVLIMNPALLIMDEPTSGLDESARERLIACLKKREATMVIVSHDHSFLEAVTDVKVTLANGRIS